MSLGANKGPVGSGFDSNGVLYAEIDGGVSQVSTMGIVSTFATDSVSASNYLVVVPEPATYLGGVLLLTATVLVLRRRVRRT